MSNASSVIECCQCSVYKFSNWHLRVAKKVIHCSDIAKTSAFYVLDCSIVILWQKFLKERPHRDFLLYVCIVYDSIRRHKYFVATIFHLLKDKIVLFGGNFISNCPFYKCSNPLVQLFIKANGNFTTEQINERHFTILLFMHLYRLFNLSLIIGSLSFDGFIDKFIWFFLAYLYLFLVKGTWNF